MVKNLNTNNVLLHVFAENGTTFTQTNTINLTAQLNTSVGSFALSENCLKIKANLNYYEYSSGTPTLIGNTASITAIDDSMNYVLASNNILKYNTTTKQYGLLYSNVNVTFSSNASIRSYENRVVIIDYN